MGVSLTDAQVERIDVYEGLLERWNQTYNLTSVQGEVALRTRHLLDCLAAITPLRKHCESTGAERILDAGSGGGLPGVVIAIACPELRVTCVDAVGKKAAFIRQVSAELGLSNLIAVHDRAERLRGPFDVITSRAFSSLADLVRWTTQALAPAGVWMAMKARLTDAELKEVAALIDVFHVEQLRVTGMTERHLVWMRPTARS